MKFLTIILILLFPSSTLLDYVRPPDFRVVEAEVTAYTSSIEETDSTPFITASGERVREGGIACPMWLDFGSEVVLDGKKYECLDRMARRFREGNYFDIWVEEKEEALRFGRQIKLVEVYQ